MQSMSLKWWLVVTVPLGLAVLGGCDGGGGGGGGGGGDVVVDQEVIVSTSPADEATGVDPDAEIIITFDRPAVPGSEDGGLFAGSTEVDIDASWSEGNTVLTVTPVAPLTAGTTYTVRITALTFADGTRLTTPYTFAFTVGERQKCETDEDCAADEECGADGECVPTQEAECETNDDCDTNEECTADGRCVPVSGGRVWEQAGFGAAGNFIGVYFDPTQSGVVYACSDVAGVYRSTDGGRTWEIRSAGLGNYQVASFAVDPHDPDTLYAGGGAYGDSLIESDKAGIYVSHDAGLSWEHLESTADNLISFRRFRTNDAIAPDPSQEGVIISGSREAGIWRTTDAGESWTQVYLPPKTSAELPTAEGTYLVADDPPAPFVPPVSMVLFDPNDSDVVYAGLLGGGVVKSTDGGESWEPANNGLPGSAVIEGLAIGTGNVVYAAAGFDGMYKSADGAASWEAVNGDLPLVDADGAGWRTFVAIDPDNPDIAYMAVASGVGIGKTTDGGQTWTVIMDEDQITYDQVNDPTRAWSSGFASTWQVKVDPFDSHHLLSVSFWTIQSSSDGGDTWADSISGAQNTCVNAVFVDTNPPGGGPDLLYAAHWDAGLLASSDGGDTWMPVIPSDPDDADGRAGHYWRFAVTQVAGTRYYYVTCDPWVPVETAQVLRSTDGTNWTTAFTTERHEGSFVGGMVGLAIDPTDPSTVYVSQDGGQVFKTTDNGEHWGPTTGQPGGNSFTYALTVDEDGQVFAGTLEAGLWRSGDGGASWQQVLPNLGTIMHCVAVPGAVYASAEDANLHRSTDGGDTWETLTAFTSVDDGDGVGEVGWAIGVDPDDPNHILFSRQDSWHTADEGAGVVESFDGGATWAGLNDGLGLPNVSSFAFAPDGTIYAGTSCGGIWRLPPAE